MHYVITFYVLCLRMDSNQKIKIMNFKELQKENEKNANQGMPTQLFDELKPLEDKNKVWFEYYLIGDIIQKYKKYKECISKLEK